jgi:hypothetical protein
MLSVKNAFRLPALFLLFFILLIVVFTGVSLLEAWAGYYKSPAEARQALLAFRLPRLLLELLPASVLVALVLTLFPMYRRPGNRFFSYLLPMGAAFLVLAFGGPALRGVLPAPRAPEPAAAAYFLPKHFQEFGGSTLYLQNVVRSRLGGVVRYAPLATESRLSYLGTAEVRLRGEEATLQAGSLTLTAPARPAYQVLFAEGSGPEARLLAGLSADLAYLAGQLEARYRSGRVGFYLTCLALVFSFFTAGVFFRVSRWPLANVLIAFLVLRGYLILFRWLRGGVAGELGKLVSRPGLIGNLPEAALLVLGAILLLVDLLFFPFDRWRKEAGGA